MSAGCVSNPTPRAGRVAGLAAGAYRIAASPPLLQVTHIPAVYNVDPPAIVGVNKPSLELRAGEIRDDIVIRLERAGAIEGRVVNESGEPMSNIRIIAERADRWPVANYRELRTDDRGIFRAFGLRPGAYPDLFCAIPSRSDSIGEPSDGDLTRRRYTKTCSEQDREPLVVRSGAEPPVATIMMQRTGAYAISGRAWSESGSSYVSVSASRRDSWSESLSLPVQMKDGHFTVRGLIPGE